MSIEAYRGFLAEGLARPSGNGGYHAQGLIRQHGHVVHESAELGHYPSKDIAEHKALLWARAVIDDLVESAE
jgi:hypothetical protein